MDNNQEKHLINDANFIKRLQALADIEQHKKIEKKQIKEDELNYYVYELLEDSDMEGRTTRMPSGYKGCLRMTLDTEYLKNNNFTGKDILESFKFEKRLYKEYIENMDLSNIANGENVSITNLKALKENENIVIEINYISELQDSTNLFD